MKGRRWPRRKSAKLRGSGDGSVHSCPAVGFLAKRCSSARGGRVERNAKLTTMAQNSWFSAQNIEVSGFLLIRHCFILEEFQIFKMNSTAVHEALPHPGILIA